ncbi:transport-associated protein [Thiorhodococcus minor]|uniref:Transport-associated protein n=1 Tax=Thiorhodococcus minor TaxID=57489 RepID=A0A6M0JWQ6_9GAMM|nr:transport-associated protein [Thiorhodococcus minor]NEV61381.1 transport-associated protein [Thiorhodococcus minor]
MKTNTKRTLLVPAATLLALSLTACGDSDDGTAEQMGQKIDEAAEQASEEMQEAKSSMSQAVESAGDKIEALGDEVESKTD